MNDESANDSLKRNVNIESAIDKSSFQIPVLVAISAAGGEAQIGKTFAAAREVFEHVFSILLDRLRQRHAVEAVASLVPQSAGLARSSDTEYVLLVRGKAVFWFSGAAARRAAGRRLLLEHARDLAEAERTPFYVLNSRTRKVRAAIVATGLIVLIPVGYFSGPFSVHWTRELSRRHAAPAPQPLASVDRPSAQDSAANVPNAGSARSARLSSTAHAESRHEPPVIASDPKPVGPEDREAILQYEKRIADFARTWPNQFRDRLSFAYPFFVAETAVPTPAVNQPGIPKSPPSPEVAKAQTTVPDSDLAEQAPVFGKSTR